MLPATAYFTHYSLSPGRFTHYSLYKLWRVTLSRQRGKCPEDLRGIMPVTGERHGQGGRHIQRKYPGIDFHRARILMPGQCLDDLPGLPVIKHVGDAANLLI